MAGLAQCGPGLCQHKRAGAKGRLRLPDGKATLPYGCGLLIPRHARNADRAAEMFRQSIAKVACAIRDLWQYVAWNAEQVHQPVIPSAATNRHERGACGIAGVANMASARQPIDKVAFNCADRQMCARVLQLRPIFERPANFRSRKIGVKQQSGLRLNHGLFTLRLHRGANVRRPPVLPYNGGRERLAGALVPKHHGLALIGDANARDPVRAPCLGHHRLRTSKRQVPDFLCIMFDKARLRIMLR